MSRLEDSRRRVRERVAEIGRAGDREVERAVALKDALLATLAAAGLLVGVRRVLRAIGRKRKAKGRKPAPPASRRAGA